jgi:hypothetical protein
VLEPVTTLRTNYVDQGTYEDVVYRQPGRVCNKLAWQPRGCSFDPSTGTTYYRGGGLAWTPVQAPDVVNVQRVYRPNIVAQQVPETTMVQRIMTRKVPIQVCRQVPEQVVRRIPYQVCRMVQEEQVRRVPYTVCRQVVERVEQQTPVQVCRMVEEEVVRQVPVTTCRMVYEERADQYQVRVCRQVAVQETLRIPRIVERKVPVVYTYRVPHTTLRYTPVAPSCCGGSAEAATIVVPAPAMQLMPVPAGPMPAAPLQVVPGSQQTNRTPAPAPSKAPAAPAASPSDATSGDTGRPRIQPGDVVQPEPEPVEDNVAPPEANQTDPADAPIQPEPDPVSTDATDKSVTR